MNTSFSTGVAALPAQPPVSAQPAPPSGFIGAPMGVVTGPIVAAASGSYAVQPLAGGGGIVQQGGPVQDPTQSPVQSPLQVPGGGPFQTLAGGPLAPDAAVAGAGVQQQLIPVLTGLITILSQILSGVSGAPGVPSSGGGPQPVETTAPPQSPPPATPPTPPSAALPAPVPAAATSAAVPAPSATAGGGPVVDRRYVTGTPAANGLVEFLISNAHAAAPGARSEGSWVQIPDGNGATLLAHVHGRYAGAPQFLGEAVQRGEVVVHAHPDGTLHLHDVA